MPEESNALVNIGDLAKPANTLIQKIADAAGILYEPRRVKKLASAEAEAERIKRLENIKTEFQERALIRLLTEELRNQENIDSVIGKALPNVNPDAEPDRIDNDFLTAFFEESKQISNDQMQSLWAALLAGEANAPGTFSKRSLKLLAILSPDEAKLFEKACQFMWVSGDTYTFIVYNPDEEDIYRDNGINPSLLSKLDEVGLLRYANYLSYSIKPDKLPFVLQYGEVSVTIDLEESDSFPIGVAGLTHVGAELASICWKPNINGFPSFCIEYWESHGFDVHELDLVRP